MSDDKVPALLSLLLKTVEDAKIFDLRYITDPGQFKGELRQAWATLYANAAYCWDEMNDPLCDAAEPEIFGEAMCERFPPLSSCWLESFASAVRQVAERKNLPEEDDREFLYFLLGVLWLSWKSHLRTLHRRPARA
jgi:hypothetical protein